VIDTDVLVVADGQHIVEEAYTGGAHDAAAGRLTLVRPPQAKRAAVVVS
jgi:hypothetical protein